MVRLTSLRRNLARLAALLLASALTFLPMHSLARAKNVYHCSRTDEKVVALTFDDGPHPRYTRAILQLLERYGIRATFFMIGENISYYPDTAKMVVAAGHEVGNHTDTHPSIRHADNAAVRREMEIAEKKISDLTGERPTLFRPPEGLCSSRVSTLASEMDYSVILWTVDTRDWASTPATIIARNVMQNVQGGDILLFHDYVSGKCTTLDALEIVIPALKAEGYSFLTVSELIARGEK